MAKDSTATIIFKGDDQISPAIKGATASVAGLSQSLAGVDTEAKQAADSIRDNLVKQIEAARQKMKDFAAQGLKSEQGQALAEFNKLNRELKKLDEGLQKLEDPIKAAGVSFKDFLQGNTEKARDLANGLRDLSGIARDIGDNFNQVASAAKQAFLEFDTAKTKVATLSGESDKFASVAIKLAGDLKNQVTSAEILTAQYEILSSGFGDVADASEIARVSVIGAKAGFTDTATVADATTSVLNAYGLAADEAASIVDKFAVTQEKGKTTIGRFGAQIGKIAPIAKAAGVSVDEFLAAIATTTATGIQTESAVSGVRGAIVSLLKPTGEAVQKLKQYGVANSAAQLRTEGLAGVLKTLAANGATSSEELSKIFTDVDGLAAVLPLMANDLKSFNSNIAALGDSAGYANKGFNIVADSAEGRIATAVNQINESLVNLGRGVSTAFAPLISAVGAAAEVIGSLPQPVQTAIGALIGITGAALTGTAALIGLGAAAPAFVQGLALLGKAQLALGVATGVATVGVGGLSTATAGLGGAAIGAVAKIGALATASISLGSVVSTIGGLLKGAGALIGTLAIKAVFSISSIIVAIAPLVLTLGTLYLAFESIRNTIGLFGEINSNKTEDALDKIFNKSTAVDQKIKEATKTSESFFDKLGGGFDKVENPIQGGALAFTNLTNVLIGAESGASKFGSQFGLITQQQLEAQKATIAYGNQVAALNGGWRGAINVVGKYGDAIDFSKKVLSLTVEEQKEYRKQLTETNKRLKEEIAQLKEASKLKGLDGVGDGEIKARETVLRLAEEKIELLDKETDKTKALADSQKQLTKDLQELAREREKDAKKRKLEDEAKKRGEDFGKTAKTESDDFEKKSRTEKQAFEKQLNADKKVFEDAQKADKKKFEDELKADTKRFTDAQKADQKTFDAGQKALDKAYEKEKQAAQRAFDLAQQAQKEAFDKRQQAAALAFDKTQNAEKLSADDQFAKRRLEIERKLQLDAAKTPEDKAKLKAEFKATDEKIAKEKAAFEQLKADELAFAEKQKADKIAFDEAQKAAQKAEDEAQKLAKQAFDDAQKAKDDQREINKQAAKEAFETQLNAKKDAFELEQNLKKEAFETAQNEKKKILEDELNLKKAAFEEGERVKKQAFETEQNTKKAAFEKGERAKKQAFEDNLKIQEAKFRAEERAKDIQGAQQVAAIKSSGNAGALNAGVGIGATPRAKGGTFRAGQQLLVGERGQELVTFGSGGYVSNATDTKQILSSNNKAPSSVSTARMEALLGQLVGKLDRPNVSVQTSENPSDVLIKIQREAARADAMRSGI